MDIFIDPRFEDLYRSDPLVLVDVGARGGLKKDWQPAARHLQVIGFEPDAREYQALRARPKAAGDPLLFGVALHNRRGPVTFQLARDRGLSSVFEPNRAFLDRFPDAGRFDITERADVEATTLDDLVADTAEIRDVDFLKVDTQGSELFVLEGARRTLRERATGVEVEVEFNPIYTDQPLFGDVDRLLRDAGFQLFDLRPVYWKRAAGRDVGGPRGQLVWADALYLKTAEGLRTVLAALEPGRRKAKILKTISIALLYGYDDFALEVAQMSVDMLAGDERQAIVGAIRAAGTTSGSSLPGQRAVAAVFHRLWKLCLPRDETAWSVSRGRLGNRD
jgi:FkbM family methyltransferase